MLQMEVRNDYRNKCVLLMRRLEQKSHEVEQLKTLMASALFLTVPALAAMDMFRKTLVTAERNGMVYHKAKVTNKKPGYAEINYRNFWDATQQELPPEVGPEELGGYKDILLELHMVCGGSFDNGGIPSRVEGRTMRVVRVPERIYRLLTEGEGDTV